ncbi:hypothetical protein ACSNOD_04970 [Streptomyces sp. URMC 123]
MPASTPPASAGADRPVRRLLVLGSPGSGKTTLTKALSAATGLPARHLDDEYWEAGWGRPRPETWERRLDALTAAERWIIDGNYLPTIERRAPRADLVLLLDAPTATCLFRVVARARRIGAGDLTALPARVRAEAAAGVPVRATRDFLPLLRMVLRFRSRDWWRGVERVRASSAAPLLVAVAPGPFGSRVAAVRRRLRARGVAATVLPLGEAREAVRRLTTTTTTCRAAGRHGTEGGVRP